MTLVDTTVWIDFFANRDTPEVKALENSIKKEEVICICGVILTEVLQGIKNDRQHSLTKPLLSNLIFVPMLKSTFFLAANIYRFLRSNGITVRNSIDCMIAAACIENNIRLLHNDRDYDFIEKHFSLKIFETTPNI